MAEQWAPFAVRRDGPGQKHGYGGQQEPGPKGGLVCHSMVGPLSAALGELDKLTRQASWTFSNPKAGRLLQHYPVGFHTWASGSLQANVLYTSCEHEGGPEGNESEPLTENQIDNLVTLCRWLHDTQHWTGYQRRQQLWEHNECVTTYGGSATACPSGRIPWAEIARRLATPPPQEDDVDTELRNWTKAASLFEQAAAYAARGEKLPPDLLAAIRFLVR